MSVSHLEGNCDREQGQLRAPAKNQNSHAIQDILKSERNVLVACNAHAAGAFGFRSSMPLLYSAVWTTAYHLVQLPEERENYTRRSGDSEANCMSAAVLPMLSQKRASVR